MTGRPKRSLSQNFLVDPNSQRKVVAELEAGPEDVVLEVGPGHGELSAHLVGEVRRLVLIEKDDALSAELAERWGERPDVEVVGADALAVDLRRWVPDDRPYRVLSNLPYAVTSPLLFAFLALRPPPERIVVTVQREVGERVVADPGGRDYGALSVGVQARADAEVAFDVSRRAFRPVPDVESVVLRIRPDPERIAALDDQTLRTLTRAAFGMRRKQLQKILRSAPEYALERRDAVEACREVAVDPKARPERLSAEEFVRLARALEGRRRDSGSGQGGR